MSSIRRWRRKERVIGPEGSGQRAVQGQAHMSSGWQRAGLSGLVQHHNKFRL